MNKKASILASLGALGGSPWIYVIAIIVFLIFGSVFLGSLQNFIQFLIENIYILLVSVISIVLIGLFAFIMYKRFRKKKKINLRKDIVPFMIWLVVILATIGVLAFLVPVLGDTITIATTSYKASYRLEARNEFVLWDDSIRLMNFGILDIVKKNVELPPRTTSSGFGALSDIVSYKIVTYCNGELKSTKNDNFVVAENSLDIGWVEGTIIGLPADAYCEATVTLLSPLGEINPNQKSFTISFSTGGG